MCPGATASGHGRAGHRAGLAKPGLTGLVDGAERRGLVERRAEPDDRHAVRVALTDEGWRAALGFHDGVSVRSADWSTSSRRERERFGRSVARIVLDYGVLPVFTTAT